jgi:multiple sugar transport system ATP-binding protein
LSFTAGERTLPVPDGPAARLGPYADRPITFGIRPEHVAWPGEGRDGVLVAAEVVLVEFLGCDRLVTLQDGDWRFTAKTNGRVPPKVGDVVEVGIEMEQAFWFDQANGLTLGLGDRAG